MIRIKLPDALPPDVEVWKIEAARITKQIVDAKTVAEKHILIEKYKNHWRDASLVKFFSQLSYDKCWYTETKFGGDYQEIEHFRPKKGTKNEDGALHQTHSGYYWLAFDLDNYRLCKRRPNAKKGTYFPIIDEHNRASSADRDWRDELPLILDPVDEEDHLFLSFEDNGKPVPALGLEKQDVRRVVFTIDKFYLDEDILNKRRAETWKTCRSLYHKYLNAMKLAKATSIDKISLREGAKRDLALLKKMLNPDEEFSAVAKQSLIKTGDLMAINIASSIS